MIHYMLQVKLKTKNIIRTFTNKFELFTKHDSKRKQNYHDILNKLVKEDNFNFANPQG